MDKEAAAAILHLLFRPLASADDENSENLMDEGGAAVPSSTPLRTLASVYGEADVASTGDGEAAALLYLPFPALQRVADGIVAEAGNFVWFCKAAGRFHTRCLVTWL